jgi:large subunit ribosomal protein L31
MAGPAACAGRGEAAKIRSLLRRTCRSAMKADIHPQYREVVFQDVTSDFKFLTRSTMGSKETIKWEDGNEYPLIKIDISSATHPFYTGQNKVMDTSGRIDKFKKRYAK